ncbi:hypothetical protein ACIG47_09905 [Promicromonospora sp. NPDC052451]|uniref:hypothetical protein n=1 Tax=Promicromonospora sp. NPDC052451 TaxID=3364407 RepID=UPI0037C6C79D
MNVAHDVRVAAEIEAALRATPGVADLYGPGSLVSNVLDAGARRLGLRDDDAPLVLVREAGTGIRVDIALGVHGTEGARATALAAHETVRGLLTDHDVPDAEIVLTVVHIEGA